MTTHNTANMGFAHLPCPCIASQAKICCTSSSARLALSWSIPAKSATQSPRHPTSARAWNMTVPPADTAPNVVAVLCCCSYSPPTAPPASPPAASEIIAAATFIPLLLSCTLPSCELMRMMRQLTASRPLEFTNHDAAQVGRPKKFQPSGWNPPLNIGHAEQKPRQTSLLSHHLSCHQGLSTRGTNTGGSCRTRRPPHKVQAPPTRQLIWYSIWKHVVSMCVYACDVPLSPSLPAHRVSCPSASPALYVQFGPNSTKSRVSFGANLWSRLFRGQRLVSFPPQPCGVLPPKRRRVKPCSQAR